MRVLYPDSIKKELRALAPYLEFDGKEIKVRTDAPEGTQERYDAVREKMHELEKI